MKSLFSFRRPIALMLSSVSLVFIYAVSVAGRPAPSMAGVNKAKSVVYTPEAFFRGVVFQKGPVANLIPESVEANKIASYTKDNSAQTEAIGKLENKIIEDIKRSKPAYFESFKDIMQSGNQILIKNKLAEAQDLVLQTVVESAGIKVADARLARKQLADFVEKNIDAIKSLNSDYYSKSISLKEYNAQVEKIVEADQSGILTALHAKNLVGNQPVGNGKCVILAIVFFVAVAAVGYVAGALAAYLYVAAAAAVEIYLAVKVNVTFDQTLDYSARSLRNDQYINSLAVNLKKV